jgi:demethylmenaquinone methyltransferase/2-methoxy-6-polyprenyl-1,4-benzoquinol methylase
MGKRGLGEIWADIVADIEWLVKKNCYERVNSFTSLLQLDRLRGKAASLLRGSGDVLDAGAGPGFSSLAVIESANPNRLVMLDPSESMLSHARRILPGRSGLVQAVIGVFESIPLSDSSLDGVVSMFAFRDAIDYEAAAREMCRVLKQDGLLVILDLYRPDSLLEEFVVRTYLALVPPLAALLTGCVRGFTKYFGLDKTLDRMPRLSELASMLRRYFREVKVDKVLPGTILIEARRPRKGACGGGSL